MRRIHRALHVLNGTLSIWHNGDITKNWAPSEIGERERIKLARVASKGAYSNIGQAAGSTDCVLHVTTRRMA